MLSILNSVGTYVVVSYLINIVFFLFELMKEDVIILKLS